jgi:hypothetical protein
LRYLIRHAEAKTHGVPPTSHNKKYPLRARALRWLVCSALRAEDARVAQAGRLFLCSSGRRCGHIDGTLRRGHRIKQSLHFGVPSTSGISRVRRHNRGNLVFRYPRHPWRVTHKVTNRLPFPLGNQPLGMRFGLLIFLVCVPLLQAEEPYESEIERAVESLRAVIPTEDKAMLEKYNNRMDSNWSVYRRDLSKSRIVLLRLLKKEMSHKPPNDLVLMDISWFLVLHDDRTVINEILLDAYKHIDPKRKIISYNAEQFFKLSLFLGGRQLPGFLELIDERFLRKSEASFFIPQHITMVDSHSQRIHLYGAYGLLSIKHLLEILKNEKEIVLRRSLTIILRRICTVECAQPIFEILKTEKDHETFVNGSYIMLDNTGPLGRELYLKLSISNLPDKTADYFRNEQEYAKKMTYDFLVGRIKRKFGDQDSSISDTELLRQTEIMTKNFGISHTIHPMYFLNSKINKSILIQKLLESRRRCFHRISRHAMDDIDITNQIINALYFKN